MSDWNSTQYLKFRNERTQPAIDLAMHIKSNPKTAVDIGCGPGNSTKILKDRFPCADIIGIDNSYDMIEKAKTEHPGIDFRLCDMHSINGKYDLLFSNACLQWIPEHSIIIPQLMHKLNYGGILAVQIPMNDSEPLFRLIKEMTDEKKWGLSDIRTPPNGTLTPVEYYNILSDCSSHFDMWEIKYYHTVSDHEALVEWVKGSRLRPYLDILGTNRATEFEKELVNRSKEIYTPMNNGKLILPFRRFFFIAVK